MGYQTTYELEVSSIDPLVQIDSTAIIAELLAFSDDASYALDEDGNCNDSCKWYDHGKEMRQFSKLHPTVLFKLIGEGEESGDLWHTYYLNGKAQECGAIVTYPPFDAEKLK